jgi:hypothetical protein
LRKKLKARHLIFLGISLSTARNLLAVLAIVLLCAGSCAPQPPVPLPGRLQLSNPNFGLINVEAVITANPDCAARDDGYVSTLEFTMPNNATKFIEAPPGADVCWRSDRNPGRPVRGRWSRWDRAYLVPGKLVDATL